MSTQIHSVVCAAVAAFALLCASAVSAQETVEGYEAGVAAFEAENYERAEEIWLPLAEAGDEEAQYALAKLYENGGDGVMRSLTKAADWYRLAAESGLAEAQNNLALLYIQGHGAPRSEKRAFQLWLKAARNGHRQAQYNLALAYYQGTGTDQDQTEAAEWFRKGAVSGLSEAQFALAEMYHLGVGVNEDPARALYWYEQARAQGHDRAEAEAGKLRASGVESKAPDEIPEAEAQPSSEFAEAPESDGVVEEDAERAVPTEKVEADEEETQEGEGRSAEVEDGNVKKNNSSGVKSENGSTGTVEFYPERMNRIVRARAKATVEDEKRREGEEDSSPVVSESQAAAGSISKEALSEMQADPLYEGAGKAAAEEDESEEVGAAAVGWGEETGELQEKAQETVTAERETDTSDSGPQNERPATQEGDFALWLGSMKTEMGARRLWREALALHEAQLEGLSYDTRVVETDKGVFLRVLAVGYETRPAARENCDAIEARGNEAFCRVIIRQ